MYTVQCTLYSVVFVLSTCPHGRRTHTPLLRNSNAKIREFWTQKSFLVDWSVIFVDLHASSASLRAATYPCKPECRSSGAGHVYPTYNTRGACLYILRTYSTGHTWGRSPCPGGRCLPVWTYLGEESVSRWKVSSASGLSGPPSPFLWMVSTMSLLVWDSCGWSYSRHG